MTVHSSTKPQNVQEYNYASIINGTKNLKSKFSPKTSKLGILYLWDWFNRTLLK